MAYSTYHQLVGPQGRAFRGYQGTRFDTPITPRSTFETRESMPPAAQPADAVAQKAVAESPSPIDAVRDLATSSEGNQTEIGAPAPEANAFEQSMMQGALADVGLGAAKTAGTNFGIAALMGAPTQAAAKYGLQSTMAPAAGIGAIADIAATGLDTVTGQENLSEYSGFDPTSESPGFGTGMAGGSGTESVAEAEVRRMQERSPFQALKERLSALGESFSTDSTRVGTFENGMRMHEDLARKAMMDPMLAPLLGQYTRDEGGGGDGMSPAERDAFGRSLFGGVPGSGEEGNPFGFSPGLNAALDPSKMGWSDAFDRALDPLSIGAGEGSRGGNVGGSRGMGGIGGIGHGSKGDDHGGFGRGDSDMGFGGGDNDGGFW